jgi:hypothetical protein
MPNMEQELNNKAKDALDFFKLDAEQTEIENRSPDVRSLEIRLKEKYEKEREIFDELIVCNGVRPP